MIKAYNRSILKIKEQPYSIIPEFQPPKKKRDTRQNKKFKDGKEKKNLFDALKTGTG